MKIIEAPRNDGWEDCRVTIGIDYKNEKYLNRCRHHTTRGFPGIALRWRKE